MPTLQPFLAPNAHEVGAELDSYMRMSSGRQVAGLTCECTSLGQDTSHTVSRSTSPELDNLARFRLGPCVRQPAKSPNASSNGAK